MILNGIKQDIIQLFRQWCGEEPTALESISAHGSTRQYWRCTSASHGCVAAWNNDVRENEAFFYFASLLKDRGIAVPEVYAVHAERLLYLQQDLGDETLAKRLLVDGDRVAWFRRVLDDLLCLQTLGKEGKVDFAKAYPRRAMDRQAWQWDFNYFKYNFLKLQHIHFDEQRLEEDFQTLIDFLLSGSVNYLMYRDFQPRNIMVSPANKLYYIDFQGARQGSPFYDVASLLYSSSAGLDDLQRATLLEYYLDKLNQTAGHASLDADIEAQRHDFYAHVLARKMQAFGAYGYRGLFEGKESFVRSIAPAAAELKTLLLNHPLPLQLPELEKVFQQIIALHPEVVSSQQQQTVADTTKEPLTVQVFSFSYKHGYPHDDSGNGGGYAFDCRALPNPGRYAAYKHKTGRDEEVRQYLESAEHAAAVDAFFQHAAAMVCPHVENFVQRGFANLMVGFGCTGGQHRSVYFAERMARYLHEKYPKVQIKLSHQEQPQLGVVIL